MEGRKERKKKKEERRELFRLGSFASFHLLLRHVESLKTMLFLSYHDFVRYWTIALNMEE